MKMAKLVCYTSPGRGHLFPTVPILLELKRRGHDVLVVTLADEVERLAAAGLRARAIAKAIEQIEHDDWRAKSPTAALDRAVRVFVARAEHEVADLEAAIRAERPDGLLVDFNCWGAAAVAEKSRLPWALFMPYFLPWRLPGLPPFGPGLAPAAGAMGRLRDLIMGKLVHGVVNRNLPRLNELRARQGLHPIAHMTDYGRSAPLVVYYTAEPFEYACPARPASVVMVGPGSWEPPAEAPAWLSDLKRPLVLVTCSTEFQDDGRLVATALEGLAGEDLSVVATTAAVDPAQFRAPANARLERFLAHGPLLARAACVVCHGGMGITQKALAAGVPTVVVPFGRDQLEVARHVEVAGAGVRLMPKKLTPARLREAVRAARDRKPGAERIAAAFRAAGGEARAAAAFEQLLRSMTGAGAVAPAPAKPPSPDRVQA
jgi:MGT family glycosyltransferase